VAAVSLCEAGDEVALQWWERPPFEAFSADADSSNESVEAVLNKYKRKRPQAGQLANATTPLPPARCAGVGLLGLEEASTLLAGLLGDSGKRQEQAEAVKAKAIALRAKLEGDEKRRKAEEKRRRAERRKALHHIPDRRERREAERRIRKKYFAIQMER
jgi:hypothetical protein